MNPTHKSEQQLRTEYDKLCDKADSLLGYSLWEYKDLMRVNERLAVELVQLDDEIVRVARINKGVN